ncbi:5-oxoprolinase subunit B/C family protein [Helcobacillus massiliensis]|uniref:5-oxoprolinase subunit B/C family protein n=1 Tax=Helcobacillus massiliensis TaxID=521392 RepID=UPI002555F913|nr:urea amidolyase family protein [Helcobacillus massiliensis]MDK7742549.1 urea amidolyase family protein [Helcobacillus massiliensis]WOO92289.1 urea amidolyase family protein [Helcobacillus massiliensis]
MSRPLRWAGARAFLVECTDLPEVMRLHAHLSQHPLPGQVQVLAAAETVLVEFESAPRAAEGADALQQLQLDERAAVAGRIIDIDVVYSGEDLREVGELTGLGADGVIAAHTGAEWTAAFGGFAPGFVYLAADGDPLQVPRRTSPRPAVPAGSVALAGAFSAVYPQKSPGGWQLIGHTDAVLWDLGREEPSLIRPGDTVRYRAVTEQIRVQDPSAAHQDEPAADPSQLPAVPQRPVTASRPDADYALEVTDPGMQALMQDMGRPGHGDLGVVASGAVDRASARQANRLVGNDARCAVVEALLDGFALTARGHHVVSVTGAAGPLRIDGPNGTRTAVRWSAIPLYDGETLRIDMPTTGLRTYVAVRGGFDVPVVLGSASRDIISGIGPEPLAAGDVLAVHRRGGHVGAPEVPAVSAPTTGSLPVLPDPEDRAEPAVSLPPRDDTAVLRILPGPRDDWFTPEAMQELTSRTWVVSNQSNRVGVRFDEPAGGGLTRARDGELASEGAVTGSLQVPHSGVPVLFLSDHPVTGGYPVIAVVVPEDLPLAGQLPPGAHVRFELADSPRPVGENA